MTTLTGGAIARCEETGRYFAACDGLSPVAAGRRTELMTLVPLVRRTARPRAVRHCVRFERGVVLTHGTGRMTLRARR
ncbi:hypothetical protein GCM10023220_01820 [Streptomyces ziwulingensis]|uniref:Uncharacterized protein n=1 Tax=Streptomyces ziwulingensis TaxID=1045501 RepID=A0ABP9ALE2_9ACTN